MRNIDITPLNYLYKFNIDDFEYLAVCENKNGTTRMYVLRLTLDKNEKQMLNDYESYSPYQDSKLYFKKVLHKNIEIEEFDSFISEVIEMIKINKITNNNEPKTFISKDGFVSYNITDKKVYVVSIDEKTGEYKEKHGTIVKRNLSEDDYCFERINVLYDDETIEVFDSYNKEFGNYLDGESLNIIDDNLDVAKNRLKELIKHKIDDWNISYYKNDLKEIELQEKFISEIRKEFNY